MRTIKILSIGLIAVFAMTACKGNKSAKNSDGAVPQTAGTAPDVIPGGGSNPDVIHSFRYYKGGGIAGPTIFEHDMTINFLTWNQTAKTYEVTAKVADPLCGKTGGITVVQVDQLITLYSQLKLYAATAPFAADGGEEIIEIKTKAGVTRKYFLDKLGTTSTSDLYASNPQDLRAFLQNLEAGLTNYCQ